MIRGRKRIFANAAWRRKGYLANVNDLINDLGYSARKQQLATESGGLWNGIKSILFVK